MRKGEKGNAAVGVDEAVDESGATGEEDAAALDGGLAFDGETRSDAGDERERERKKGTGRCSAAGDWTERDPSSA